MSEELAIVSDTDNGGSGVIAAFVLGSIVAGAACATVSCISRVRSWRAVRKELRNQEVIEAKVEKAVQKKS